jgi:NitT/TauT family transport system substrate-binding protein
MKVKVHYLLMFVLILLTGCQESQPPPLRVGVNPWVGHDPLVLAQEQALVDAKQVRIIELMSNSESTRALRNDLLDAAAMTLDEALRLVDSGVALKIVAVLDASQGADAVLARTDIASPVDLKGKRIALEKTALGALMLEHLLKAGGLTLDQVETLQVETAMHDDVLANGRVDAVITFEPMKSHLLNQGFHSLFDSSQMPGEVVDVLVVKAEIEPGRTVPLLQAWQRGLKALQADPEAAAALLSVGTDLNREEYLNTLKGLRFISLQDSATLLTGPLAPFMHDAEALTNTLQRLELIKHAPDWNGLLDNRAALQTLELQP